ncbi:hypothetical protein [Heliobacterium mobile]|nr:hypothetical protein [Heliobacterium mobile]
MERFEGSKGSFRQRVDDKGELILKVFLKGIPDNEPGDLQLKFYNETPDKEEATWVLTVITVFSHLEVRKFAIEYLEKLNTFETQGGDPDSNAIELMKEMLT